MNRILLLVLFLTLISQITFSQNDTTLFKIKEIKRKGHNYVIVAQRHDSLFKIISEKVEIGNKAGIEKIEKGESYYLEFDRFYETPLILNYLDINRSKRKSIKYNKEVVQYHFRFYHTNFLKGIYYLPASRKE